MDIIRTALLGATALSLALGTATAGGLNSNAQSQKYHGSGIAAGKVLPKAKAKVLAASVNADGTLAHGVGATGATTFGSGLYEVDFSRDVQNCTYVATLGNATYGTAPPGSITDAERSGNPNGVWVEIWNLSGTNVAENFHLAVAC